MSVTETHKDIYPLFRGAHQGPTGLTLRHQGADFKSCGAMAGLAIYNDTDGSNGAISSVISEDELICTLAGGTLNVWTAGDIYSIYVTDTYNSKISKINTDKRYGRKVTDDRQLVDGLFPEDRDLDEDNEEIFGPGQPSRRF